MSVAVDTNVLLRFLLADHPVQHAVAAREIGGADRVIFPLLALCETVWVLRRTYSLPRADIAVMLRALTEIGTADFDRRAVDAGLAMLDAGGDFSDGVIAFQGRQNGAATFVSFDRKAVELCRLAGLPARLLT